MKFSFSPKLNQLFHRASQGIFLAFLLLASSLQGQTYPQTVLNAGPVAYWRFESVNDVSLTNSFTNNFQGDATVTAPGGGVPLIGVQSNHALLLDGTNDIVLTGVSNQFTFASNGTFMAWVNFGELPSATSHTSELIVKSHFNSPLDFLLSAENRLQGYAGDFTPVFYDFNPALATNTWYHLAFTFDNAGQFKRLYVNGVLVGDLPLNPNLTGSADEITIGNSTVFTDRSFNGRMDEVALFDRALTGAEIQTIFNSGGVTTPAPQPVVRVNIEFTREVNALEYGNNQNYGLALYFTILPVPFNSTNRLHSPHTNHSVSIGGSSGSIGGGGAIYGTFGEALNEATNGLWTLVLNEGEVNQQVYRFALSNISNLTVNDYALIDVTSPLDDTDGNAPDVAFTWTQSQPWLLNHLDLDGPTSTHTSVPPGSTSWTNPPTLNLGRHGFNLYLRTNAMRWIGITTPTNGASQPLANWDGSAQLTSQRGIRFRVGPFIPPPPGLQAHLRFDDEDNLGLDSSGKGNDAFRDWYDQPPEYNTDGLDGGAASFTHGGWLEFQDTFSPALGGDFTVTLWVKTTQASGNNDDDAVDGAGIVGRFIGREGKTTIPLALNGSKAGFKVGNRNGSSTLHSTNDINNSGTDWVHVAVTRNQTTGKKRIYINGVLDASEVGNTNLLNDGEPVRIGYGNNVTYNGLLDDVQIYSASLTATNIAYLFANPGEAITNFVSLKDAVDAPQLTWISGGDETWFGQTDVTLDAEDAAQSGAISDDEESWIQTTVNGPGTLSFWWKVLSEDNADYLDFLIDGSSQDSISGDFDWEQRTYTIDPGPHTLRWNYYKNDTNYDRLDAGFLDQVSFVAPSPPVITVNPFNQTNQPGYNVALFAATTNDALVSWQWFKTGSASPIPDATNALFIPTNSGTAGVAGNYYAIASTGFNSANTTTAAVSFVSAALPPDWATAFRAQLYGVNFSDATTNYGIACLLDSSGNIYSANSFTGTNFFGSETIASGGNRFSSALLKHSTNGTAIWGRALTNNGDGNSYPQCVAAAPGDGVYMSGVFFGTNWLGTNELVDIAGASVYLARFDSNGSNLWVRTFGGTNTASQSYHQLFSDSSGNVTISALVQNTVSFGTTNVTVDGQKSVLVQYDANGNLRWVQLPSGWFQYLAYSAGRIYGCMDGHETNYAGGLTNVSDRHWSLVALNATNAQAAWLRGIASDLNSGVLADTPRVAVSGTNVFVVGTGTGSNAVFGPFSVSWPAATGQYFARYDTNGTAQLATAFGSETTIPWAAVADASGNVYVGGDFDTYSVFGNGIIAAPQKDVIGPGFPGQTFLAKFDRNGNPLWARPAQSPLSYANLRDIALANDGIWACGFVNQYANFGSHVVYGTTTCLGSPFCFLQYHVGGWLAKITDISAVALPVTLLNPQNPGANLQFQFLSQSGFTHTIESRTNLATGNWLPRSNIVGDGTLKAVQFPATNKPGEFFRVGTQ